MSSTSERDLLRVQRRGRLTVVEFTGPVDDFDVASVQDRMTAIIRENNSSALAFDLTRVDYMTSAVLGFLVGLLQMVDSLHVYNPSDYTLQMIEDLNLDSVMQVHTGWDSDLYSDTGDQEFQPLVTEPSEDATVRVDPVPESLSPVPVATESAPAVSATVSALESVDRPADPSPAAARRPAAPLTPGQPVGRSVSARRNQTEATVRDHVANEIRAFEATLDDASEVVIHSPAVDPFILERVTFRDNDVIVFAGRDDADLPVELVQCTPQIQFGLSSRSRAEDSAPRRRIDFFQKSFPIAGSVVRD